MYTTIPTCMLSFPLCGLILPAYMGMGSSEEILNHVHINGYNPYERVEVRAMVQTLLQVERCKGTKLSQRI